MGFASCAAGSWRWTFYLLDISKNLEKPSLERRLHQEVLGPFSWFGNTMGVAVVGMGLIHPGPFGWVFPSLWSPGLGKNWKWIQDLAAGSSERKTYGASAPLGFPEAGGDSQPGANFRVKTSDFR